MPKRNTDLERGERFLNRYEIIAPIAGRVHSVAFYKVLDLCYDCYRTLKLLSDSPKYAERALARLRAGLQLLRGCQHEDVETVFEFGQLPQGVFYIVSEWVEGQPLSERCDREQLFSPEEARSIVAAACSALAEAHRRSISFRVSPRNIILSDARVVLIDFGLQTWFTDTVRELCLFDWWYDHLLQPEYDPPFGRGDAGDDLYSLGVVLFEMLTGDLPFP
jgi:serine/threonine-protein kinase